uniref:Uncharacterized protein n=1 Tax=Panagrellus redivivus TaxID=6233 RepID=A0A7E4VKD3_PANRE
MTLIKCSWSLEEKISDHAKHEVQFSTGRRDGTRLRVPGRHGEAPLQQLRQHRKRFAVPMTVQDAVKTQSNNAIK